MGLCPQFCVLPKQNDERNPNRCHLQLEGPQTLCDTVPNRLSAVASMSTLQLSLPGQGTYTSGRDATEATFYKNPLPCH